MAGKWSRFRGPQPSWELAWTMNWVDRLRTSADKRMWSRQEITRVILCHLILNDIIIHIKFLNDTIIFSKIV